MVAFAKEHDLVLRQNYNKQAPRLAIQVGRYPMLGKTRKWMADWLEILLKVLLVMRFMQCYLELDIICDRSRESWGFFAPYFYRCYSEIHWQPWNIISSYIKRYSEKWIIQRGLFIWKPQGGTWNYRKLDHDVWRRKTTQLPWQNIP